MLRLASWREFPLVHPLGNLLVTGPAGDNIAHLCVLVAW